MSRLHRARQVERGAVEIEPIALGQLGARDAAQRDQVADVVVIGGLALRVDRARGHAEAVAVTCRRLQDRLEYRHEHLCQRPRRGVEGREVLVEAVRCAAVPG